MSTKRGGASRGPPKHQNKHAYKPFLGVKKNPGEPGGSDGRSFAPIAGVCVRCKEQLEWKRKYGKYKPLVEPTKCIWCQKRNVRSAYHAICSGCAHAKGACGKCCKQVRDIVGKDAEQEEAERKRLEEALSGMRERDRRTLLRAMEKGSVKVAKGAGTDGEDLEETSSQEDVDSDLEDEVKESAERSNSGEAASRNDCHGNEETQPNVQEGDSESEWDSEDERGEDAEALDRSGGDTLHEEIGTIDKESEGSKHSTSKLCEREGEGDSETTQGKVVDSLGKRIERSVKVEDEGIASQTPIAPSANGA